MDFTSKYLEQAVQQFASLPGIGSKTALRLVMHLLQQDAQTVQYFGKTLTELKDKVLLCNTCGNLTDTPTCSICTSTKRNRSLVCLVEDVRVLMNIENSGQYYGLYHVLGGLISPMNGIGPNDLNLAGLITRLQSEEISEVILALSPTSEGDTTAFYVSKKLVGFDIKISAIARGVAFGGELEYADEVTLGRSIVTRVPYNA